MVIVVGNGPVTLVQGSVEAVYISNSANILGKSMNQIILSPALSK